MRVVALAALLATAASAAAQDASTPGTAGAEAAVRAYVEAFASADWETAVDLMDPDEVAEFADLVGLLADADAADGFDLGAPEDPRSAVAAFFEQLMGAEPLMGEAMGTLEAAVIGTVLETDSLAHVVGRSRFAMGGGEMGGVEVTTVRWTGDRWAVTFGEKLRGFRQMVRTALGEHGAEADG